MNSTKKQLISGITYIAISKYTGIVVSLVVTGILSRLIVPEDFGVVAVATVIISFFSIFSDVGIAPAIIQNKKLTTDNLSDIFCFTIFIGLILTICFFFASWPIASYYDNVQLRTICKILSINLFFVTVNIVPNALFYKNKQFKFLAIRNLTIQLVSGIIAVIAALKGLGLYALLINPIISSVSIFIIGFRKYPQKIRWTLGISSVKIIFVYSAYQFLFNIINYFSRNLDKLLMGKYLSMKSLGYYEKSYRFMMLPLQNITHVISPVLHPVFSDLQDDLKKLSGSYLKIISLLSFIGFPLSIFLFFSAREIMLLILGMQWTASVPVFQILSLSVGIQIILSTSGPIFQAANDTRMLFVSGLLSSILNVASILIGIFVFKTTIAVAWGLCISFTINFIQCYVLMYRFTFKLNMLPFWRQLVSPLILSSILFMILFLINKYTINWTMWSSLIFKGIFFIIPSIVYMQFFYKEYNIFKIIHSLIRKIK